MKFAHEFKTALQREGFPRHWVDSAIPYHRLKKVIKKVEAELSSMGLDLETLSRLIPSNSTEETLRRRSSADIPVAFRYQFKEDPKTFDPKLTLYVNLEDGVAVDASLSPSTRKYIEGLAAMTTEPASLNRELHRQGDDSSSHNGDLTENLNTSLDIGLITMVSDTHLIQRIEVPLTFDTEFFDSLQSDVYTLDSLQAGEQEVMTNEIKDLSRQVAKVASPSRSKKTDLQQWRELFDLYLQAGIFFSTNELDHGSRNSATALKQLQWFQGEVMSMGIIRSFKLASSREALEKFLSINLKLLSNLKFQEMNQVAISKILKKFDKRTALGAKDTFPKLLNSQRIMSQMMAKAVCAEVSNEIVKLVPQLDDYLCPVCFSISYRPVRLTCSHVFCIRCMIQMQKQKAKFCPLCRSDAVMHADSTNLDKSLATFLKTYFPKETKIKQKENEIAAGVELYGEDYANAKCVIM